MLRESALGTKSLKELADEGKIDEFFDKFALHCEQSVLTVVGRCEGYDESARAAEIAFEALKTMSHSLAEQGVDKPIAIKATVALIDNLAFGTLVAVIHAGLEKAEQAKGDRSDG